MDKQKASGRMHTCHRCGRLYDLFYEAKHRQWCEKVLRPVQVTKTVYASLREIKEFINKRRVSLGGQS